MPHDELLADLSETQRQAVTHTSGPLLVLAGAGSGKTRVITRRAAWIAATVPDARGVLAITFTNKAAGEMRERIEPLAFGRRMLVCTFHSLCARLLREYAHYAGLKPGFSIYDQADRLAVIRDALDDCQLSADHWRPRTIEYRISQAKNDMIGPEEFAASQTDFTGREIARVYAAYQRLMHDQNAVDFDDLLVLTARMLGDHADLRDALEDRFPYLLIDEYQDTNHPQYLIARRLTHARRNICATGDPDQSIYGWRGANINNILDFETDYPDARVVRLEQNYRSTPAILSAASALISHNHRRKKKDLWTENPPGRPVRVWRCEDEHQEAERIADEIARHCVDGGSPGDVAIFYRINALTRVLEDALRRARIPYQIARGVEFYARREIKDVLAYLRLIVNPADDTAFKRAINTPARGIGKTTLDRLAARARDRHAPLDTALAELDAIPSVKSARKKLEAFAALLGRLRALPRAPVKPLLEAVLRESGLERALFEDPDPEKDALRNVHELINAAAEFDEDNPVGSLLDWLEQISLVSDVDRINLAGGAVTLMTLHAAKGLEFPMVYIVGLEQDLLPHHRALIEGDNEIEEERRLCFVGMTRAISRLTLTFADYRAVRGSAQRTVRSQFLRELPLDEIDVEGPDERRADGYDPHVDFDYDAFDAADWQPGRRVRHPDYGDGIVVGLERRGRAAWVRVRFETDREVPFSLAHAPLSFLEC